MCIIFHKPAGIVLSRDTLENCFRSNSHGAGFMAAIDGKLIVKKGYFTFESFWEAYQPFQDANLVAHFRWATHGLKNEENCHPFLVTDELGFAHNGVIYGIHQTGSQYSDTWHFNEHVLKPLLGEFEGAFKHKTIKYLITKKIGGYNKLVFLHADGSVAIYNEEKGTKKFGCWFSNDDFERSRYRSTTSSYSGSYGGRGGRGGVYSQFCDDYGYWHESGCGAHYSSSSNSSNNYSSGNSSCGWNGGNVVSHVDETKKNEGASDNTASRNAITGNDLVKKSGKVFIATDDGLIEVSQSILDAERPRVEEIVSDNEYYVCDNCNDTVKEEDLVETVNFRLCKNCIQKEGAELAGIDPMLRQLISA